MLDGSIRSDDIGRKAAHFTPASSRSMVPSIRLDVDDAAWAACRQYGFQILHFQCVFTPCPGISPLSMRRRRLAAATAPLAISKHFLDAFIIAAPIGFGDSCGRYLLRLAPSVVGARCYLPPDDIYLRILTPRRMLLDVAFDARCRSDDE